MFRSRHVWFFVKQKWCCTARDRHHDRSSGHFWLFTHATPLTLSPAINATSSIAEWAEVDC